MQATAAEMQVTAPAGPGAPEASPGASDGPNRAPGASDGPNRAPGASDGPNRAPGAPSPAPDKTLAADLYALIMHLHRDCNPDLLEAVGTLELSLSQIKLLHHLDGPTTELTLKQGAEAVRVSLPAASRLVDDLVGRGFIERHEDATDRRMKRIQLTDHGRAVIARLNQARLTGLERFVATLNPTERRALTQLLGKLLVRDEIAAARPQVETP